jgi:pyridoxine 5-phosphate synthase
VHIAGVEELNIGHSIISRAVLVGMERAVGDMKEAMTAHFPLATIKK